MLAEMTNAAMRSLLQAAMPRLTHLDPDLQAYLEDGLAIEADGSVLSAAAARGATTGRAHFPDRVAYEAFVNKIHLDDWGSATLADSNLEEKLAHALALADALGDLAEQRGVTVAVIVSADTSSGDVVFRFHGVRPSESPWLGRIDGYAEPVLVRMYGPPHP